MRGVVTAFLLDGLKKTTKSHLHSPVHLHGVVLSPSRATDAHRRALTLLYSELMKRNSMERVTRYLLVLEFVAGPVGPCARLPRGTGPDANVQVV